MKKSISLRGFSAYRIWTQLPSLEISYLPDLLMFGAAIAMFYGVLVVGRAWLGPFTPEVEISRSPLGPARLRGIFSAAHRDCLFFEPALHAGLRVHRGL